MSVLSLILGIPTLPEMGGAPEDLCGFLCAFDLTLLAYLSSFMFLSENFSQVGVEGAVSRTASPPPVCSQRL